MRVAVLSDVHRNAVALQAVIDAALAAGVDAFWVVGDLAANGPQPAEALTLLRSPPGLVAVRGNTDRYVLAGRFDGIIPPITDPSTPEAVHVLVDTAAAHAWTRGCITTAGHFDWLARLPLEQRCLLPDNTRVLLVHASPGRDDGPGLHADATASELAEQGWTRCDADLVFVGHTHEPLDRTIDETRVINVGSVSLPHQPRGATWSLLEANHNGHGLSHHVASYDRRLLRATLDRAHHPTATWLTHKLHLD